MRTYGGATISGKLPAEVRVPLQEIDVFLQSVSATLTVSQGTQTGGGTSVIPTIIENDALVLTRRAVPIGAAEALPGKAHWLRCNSSGQLEVVVEGEVSVAELPATVASATLQASGSHLPFPSNMSYIGGLMTVRRPSTLGSNPDAIGIITGAPWRDFTYGYQSGANTDENLSAHVMEVPKPLLHQHTVFEGQYYAGGIAGYPTVTFGTGGGAGNDDVYPSARFRRMTLSFQTRLNGTPSGEMNIRVYGINEVSGGSPVAAHSSLIKRWVFDATNWTKNGSTANLEFEIEHPYFVVTIVAPSTGQSAGTNFEILNFFITGKN